ncbi:NUMOD4 domain-containing protein [Limosilactobacillus reuteri]|uniref:NUMOD4 domain-containing protein n=1 Tax=Limosilactobacillus reuteri TaxID=1598 RepID=UPI001E3EF781|nr:NUMOD4 domain-containing protein [Limosilactobacillus reuteri]MCC4518350.1 HNH endonuclease [Limosilactobacillus reuteri]
MTKEVWKNIPSLENYYMVSNMGRVYAKSSLIEIPHHGRKDKCIRKPHFIKQSKNADGYYQVTLSYRNRKRKSFMVHRLVLSAFTGEPYESALQVNHKDEDPSNNQLENLEWCTAKYNVNYGSRTERAAITNGKPIIAISPNGKQYSFPSASEAGRKLGLRQNHISECLSGKRKTVGKYTFKSKLEELKNAE